MDEQRKSSSLRGPSLGARQMGRLTTATTSPPGLIKQPSSLASTSIVPRPTVRRVVPDFSLN